MGPDQTDSPLSHLDTDGTARMVDVSGKPFSTRTAVASATVHLKTDVLDLVMGSALPKGDALAVARVAGIQAAKNTGQLIPLCHTLPLDWVQVDFDRAGPGDLTIRCTARTTAKTGVEMEALTAVTVAALTIYDMAKAADKAIVIGPIQLERKEGGRSGLYERKSS
jgi:cyclic pyranopterin phosphate synthase